MNKANQKVRIILVTFPSPEIARQIGTLLVESQLAACINLVPGVESIYQWEGQVNSDNEVLGIIKSTESVLEELERVLIEKHPYDVPEFLVITPESGFEGYMDWVVKACSDSN